MKPVFRVLKEAGRWKGYIITATIMLMVHVGINLIMPMIAREVIILVEPMDLGVRREIWYFGALLLALYIARSISHFIDGWCSHKAAFNVIAKMRVDVYNHLQTLSAKYYSDKQTGQIVARAYDDTWHMENLVAHAVPDLIVNSLTVVGALTFMFVISPALALMMCIPLPLILFMSVFMRKMRKHWKKHRQTGAELMALFSDNIQGMKEVQVFGRQEYESTRVGEKISQHSKLFLKGMTWSYVTQSLMSFIHGISKIIIIVVGGFLALRGQVDAADITAMLLYGGLLYVPVAQFARIAEDIQVGSIAAGRVFEVLDTKSEVVDREGARDVGALKGDIEFKNVAFSYNNDIPVLRDVSFAAPSGKMVALVGTTGVGKTTIASLLARFYDITGGSIMIDGIDIRDMTLASLRKQISIVLQDVFLFNGTIAENIAYGCAHEVTEEEIIEAARTAAVHDFVDGLPDKYQTLVGERGTRLSGGQKQRIAIARAVLRKSPILILDEATSSVDNETEREIQRAIDQIMGQRTMIVIAHRLTTIEKADKVLRLENGCVTVK
jgi:ATP-binding cassette subfamily B protein/subfamily B ATP-binding cassette protein MsbA